MKNPAPYIRTQLFSLLEGAVPYENSIVPVFESGSEGEEQYKILIADMSPFPQQTKASQSYTYDVTLEVVYEGPDNVRRHIDAISEKVMQLINPNLYAVGIANNEDWYFTGVNINAPRYIDDLSASGMYIKRALMTLNFLITQRTY